MLFAFGTGISWFFEEMQVDEIFEFNHVYTVYVMFVCMCDLNAYTNIFVYISVAWTSNHPLFFILLHESYLFIFLGGSRYHILSLFSSFQPGFFCAYF